MILRMEQLVKTFERAKELKMPYIGITIYTEELPANEIKIIPLANYDIELDYYQNFYTDDLYDIDYPNDRITGFAYGESLDSIEYQLLPRS